MSCTSFLGCVSIIVVVERCNLESRDVMSSSVGVIHLFICVIVMFIVVYYYYVNCYVYC